MMEFYGDLSKGRFWFSIQLNKGQVDEGKFLMNTLNSTNITPLAL